VIALAALTALCIGADGGDPWEFDKLTATVDGKGETTDALSTAALAQLGLSLAGKMTVNVSAHANTVGGVTLRIEDPADPKGVCELYANREGDHLVYKDSRCSFPVFTGSLRSSATCRKISGTARRVKQTIALDASSPDCTAQPMGLPLTVRATISAAK
jgi:hypothetical protein